MQDMNKNTNHEKVFISYSWKNKVVAQKIEKQLKLDGIDVWIDYDRFLAGESLPERISQALEWCTTLVLMWSKSAKDSYYVGREWQNALVLKKNIIPCRLDNTPLPGILSSLLSIDFNSIDDGYKSLSSALKLSNIGNISRNFQKVKITQNKNFQMKNIVFNSQEYLRKSFMQLFEVIIGSDLKPTKLVLFSLVLITFFCNLYWSFDLLKDSSGLIINNHSFTSFGKCLYFSAVTFSTIGSNTLEPIGFWGKYLQTVEVFLGIIMFVLFIASTIARLLKKI